jgi:hypothetical protein
MLDLESLYQGGCQTSEPLGYSYLRDFRLFRETELLGDLLFSQSVVLEPLGCLCVVDVGGEDIVEAKLSRKYVHHHPFGIIHHCWLRTLCGVWLVDVTVLSIGSSVQDVCAKSIPGAIIVDEKAWTDGYVAGRIARDLDHSVLPSHTTCDYAQT